MRDTIMMTQREKLAVAQEKVIRLKILGKMARKHFDYQYHDDMDMMSLWLELMIETTIALDELLAT